MLLRIDLHRRILRQLNQAFLVTILIVFDLTASVQYKVPYLLREPLVSLKQKTLFDNVVAAPHRNQIVDQLKLL